MRAAAARLGVTLLPVEFRSADDLEAAFAAVAQDRADALIMFSDVLAHINAQRIATLASEHRLPAMFPFREVVDANRKAAAQLRIKLPQSLVLQADQAID